ncbi:hypothetical protein VHEMI01422 [[Torrubiella] hemipterigena]|uniref:Mitochondrial import inner membrane translocase subunit TIM50 n=1 Tax=[Torrubiella] hemipterigena TaxID=1531966 RepID=A0A0A1T7G0_9HYPO|nr:hypothetical protein VHEMI01422 [[Torrubiella] hemipterigena]
MYPSLRRPITSSSSRCAAATRPYARNRPSIADYDPQKVWPPRLRSAQETHYRSPPWTKQKLPRDLIEKIDEQRRKIQGGMKKRVPGLELLPDIAPQNEIDKAKRALNMDTQNNKAVSNRAQHLQRQREETAKTSKGDNRPRQPPSAESGGVPEPTDQYLQQAYGPPRPIATPKKILVIMDLNGTLLYRPNKKQPFTFQERPHAKRFLRYCIDTFAVAIWSSARPINVHKMVERLLAPDLRTRCVVIWGRDKFGLSAEDYDGRTQCYKRLTKIWANPAVIESHPEIDYGMTWDQTNTILVDDSKEKARSEPFNLLQIPEFSGVMNEPTDVLPQVHDYLNTLCHQSDISRYVRESPFVLNTNYQIYPQQQQN